MTSTGGALNIRSSATWGRVPFVFVACDRMRTTLTPVARSSTGEDRADIADAQLPEFMSWKGSRLGGHSINHHPGASIHDRRCRLL